MILEKNLKYLLQFNFPYLFLVIQFFIDFKNMYAAQNQTPTIIDSLSSNISDWYEACDNAIAKSEIIPGTYEYTSAVSYGNVGTIQEGSSTMVDIACNRFEIISIDNSYVYLEQEFDIKVPKLNDNRIVKPLFYFGYQYAPECIAGYRLYSNSDQIQTVNFANYEWFALRNSVQPEAKETSSDYATIEKIRRMDPNVPGVYLDLSQIDDNRTIKVKLNTKVYLNSFLTLRHLRYIANFQGKITIELIPSYHGVCICTVENPLEHPFDVDVAGTSAFAVEYEAHGVKYNFGFHNIGQVLPWRITAANDQMGTPNYSTFTITCDKHVCSKCEIRLAKYMLQMDAFNALASKYIQVPLLFPIHKIVPKDYTKTINADASIDNAMTVELKHADGMFTVFKKDNNSYTCFENPGIEYQFNVDGKMYPREQIKSYDDCRSVNLTLDAMNFNNLPTTSVNKDFANSVQPYRRIKNFENTGASSADTFLYTTGDRSNYWMGIPLSDSEDFMGGISTSGTVQIQLIGRRDGPNANVPYAQPVGIFTCDALLKLRSMKPAGSPQISITNASIEQVLAAAGMV